MMRRLVARLALVLSAFVGACEPDLVPATQILVSVESEFGEELKSLQVQVFDPHESTASDSDTYSVQGLRTFTFAVVPAPERPQESVLVVVRGLDADDDVLAEAKAVVTFVSGEKRGLDMVLSDGCRGQVCGPAQTCSAATNFSCAATTEATTTPIDPTIDAGNEIVLEPVTRADGGATVVGPSGQGSSADAAAQDTGAPPDASVAPDAGMDAAMSTPSKDAGTRDSGQPGTDTGPASTLDAGGDAGVDAGVDAGPPRPACCPSGDCLCREAPPAALAFTHGVYQTAFTPLSTGTIYYPNNATAPFAALAMVSGFQRTGSDLGTLGQFFASHGIVAMAVTTPGAAPQDERAPLLRDAIELLKAEQTRAGGPLQGKLSGRYGILGYSTGGGAALIVAKADRTLRSVVGLGVHTGDVAADPRTFTASGISAPTLLYCGVDDTLQSCTAYTDPSYTEIAATTAKMKIIAPDTAFADYTILTKPVGATTAMNALAFEKVFLEGDERWRTPLLNTTAGTVTTNIR